MRSSQGCGFDPHVGLNSRRRHASMFFLVAFASFLFSPSFPPCAYYGGDLQGLFLFSFFFFILHAGTALLFVLTCLTFFLELPPFVCADSFVLVVQGPSTS
ncbi:hypothetical protein B0T14DRAFT_513022 [Immersiella caudata]|uniref:Transmembrane protein n=1 Tax=Immersiella caudata TaxID=314043 RepID=A0AA39X6D5_9PEZI|nr:hypothetical protein B0T14DRAFT_513022 [Immersiella caudata]